MQPARRQSPDSCLTITDMVFFASHFISHRQPIFFPVLLRFESYYGVEPLITRWHSDGYERIYLMQMFVNPIISRAFRLMPECRRLNFTMQKLCQSCFSILTLLK